MTHQLIQLNELLQQIDPTLSLYPAGIWKLQDGKKQPIDPLRKDGLNLADYPNDNMLKLFLKAQVVVIDVDDKPLAEVEALYPTLASTLSTTTTNVNKRHYYLLPPENYEWYRTRSIGNQGVDYLSNGTVFEGHIFNDPNTVYQVHNLEQGIQRATEQEYSAINSILQSTPEARDADLTLYANPKMKLLIEKYIKNPKLDLSDHNKLCRLIMNKQYRDANKNKRTRLTIEPSYMNMNTIAVKISTNISITTELRDKFLEKWVLQEWGFNRNSGKTRQRLDKGILPSLPTRLEIDPVGTTLEERLSDLFKDADFAIAKTLVNGTLQYFDINTEDWTPRRTGRNEQFLYSRTALTSGINDKDEIEYLDEIIQPVTIVDNPYKAITFYDAENKIDYFNVARKTAYEKETAISATLPDNPITRAIKSYFGSHFELYLHWLAHTTLGSKSPILIPFLVSPKSDTGGTGKSLNAVVIPSALAYAVSTISPQTMTSDWGDATSAARLVALNDIPPMSEKDWDIIYGKMRDETSQGMRRRKNMKYAGFVEVTDSYAISVSANYVPSLDPHDRRAWVVLPQHLDYGDTLPVSKEDADWLDIFAQDNLTTYYPELSDLMAYLRYLYTEHRDKYKEELYRKAPKTKGRDMAVNKGTTYSSRIISSIQLGPEELFELMLSDEYQFNDDVPLGMTSSNTVTQQQIAQVIVVQYYDGKVYLPSQFLAEIQHRVASSDTANVPEKHNTLVKLCFALGLEKEKFKQTAPQHHFTTEKIEKHNLPTRMVGSYAQRQIPIIMGEPTLDEWKRVADGN